MIQVLLPKLVHAAANAVARYVEVSGLAPDEDMPETFVQSYILDKLGSEFALTCETSLAKLLDWSRNEARRKGVNHDWTDVKQLQYILGKPRVDLVVFEGGGNAYDERDLLALVEIKRHNISLQDRQKILSILDRLPTCDYGVLISVVDVETNHGWMGREHQQARDVGDVSHVSPVVLGKVDLEKHYSVFGRAFSRPARA